MSARWQAHREFLVVRSARRRVDQAATDALDEGLVRDLELDHRIDLAELLGLEHLTKHLSLRHRAREAIQDEAVCAFGRFDVVLDDPDHDVIAHQTTRLHQGLRLHAHLRACRQKRKAHGVAPQALGQLSLGSSAAKGVAARRACIDRSAQQVAGGQVTQAVLVLDDRGLPGSTLCMGCRCVLYSLCGHMGCWLEPRTCVPLPLPGGPTRMIFLPGGASIRRLSSASRSMVATF